MSNKIQGVEIFSLGTHNGMEFKDADLDAIVSSFDALNKASRVPLKFGHNDAQPITDGQPALGWVEQVRRVGAKILADFTDVPTIVFEAIRKGLYKQVSIELLKDFSREGSRYPWVLDAVALLGADIPAVKGLRDLQTLMMARQLPNVRFASAAAFTLESTIGDRAIMTDEEIKALKARLEKAEADAKGEKDARLKFEADTHKEKVAAHREGVKTLLEQSVTEGRIFPRVRDRILNGPRFKDDAEVLTAYSIDAVKAEIKDEQRNDFKEKPAGQKGATSMANGNEDESTLEGKSVAEVMTFKTEQECVRVGGKVSNWQDMEQASARVLRANRDLAKQYFDDPRQTFKSAAAA